MANATSEIIIDAPVQEVFDYTASAINGPAFIPNLNENTNISPEEPGIEQTFDWRFNMGGVDLTGRAEGIEYTPGRRVYLRTIGDVNADWDYQFEDLGDGRTRLFTTVNYEVSDSKLQAMVNRHLVDKINQHTLDQMCQNLKLILESGDED